MGGARSIGALSIVPSFDPQTTIGISAGLLLFVEAIAEKLPWIVLFDPDVDMLDINRDGFAESWNLVAELTNRVHQQ